MFLNAITTYEPDIPALCRDPDLAPEQFGLERAYAFQEGRIMAPSDLSVGSHQLVSTIVFSPGEPPEVREITFFVDAPGTGVCL